MRRRDVSSFFSRLFFFLSRRYIGGYSELERLEESEQLTRALGLPEDEVPEDENVEGKNPAQAPGPGKKKKKKIIKKVKKKDGVKKPTPAAAAEPES